MALFNIEQCELKLYCVGPAYFVKRFCLTSSLNILAISGKDENLHKGTSQNPRSIASLFKLTIRLGKKVNI